MIFQKRNLVEILLTFITALILVGVLWFGTAPSELANNIEVSIGEHIGHSANAHTDMPGSLPHNIPDFTRESGRSSVTSVTSGNWSAPSTWVGGVVPTSNHIVKIDSEHTVTITDRNASAHTIAVFGKLAFSASANSKLTVNNLMILPEGTLQIGTSSQPIPANLKAEIVFADKPLNMAFDPEQFGNGLIGLGKIYIHGSAKTPFVKLAVEPQMGHTTLTSDEAVSGWQVGDLLRLPNSNQVAVGVRGRGYEEFYLTSISSDKKVFGLSSAVAYEHPGARDADAVTKTVINGRTLMPYVMNTTRNVIIRSENPAGNRGHILITHRADLDMRYAEVSDMGRTTLAALNSTTFDSNGQVVTIGTNQIGRYSFHLHHLYGPVNSTNTGYQYEMVGNSIHDGRKWGIAIHGTHYGLFQGNVMYDHLGSGVFTEDGSESYNVFEKNFISNISGGDSTDSKDGRAADPFWFHSPTNYVRDNVASNGSWGFSIFMQDLDEGGKINSKMPKFRGADITNPEQYTLVNMRTMPILEFARNEAYSVSDGGLNVWSLGEAASKTVPRSLFKDTYIWHQEHDGFFAYGMHNTTVDGLYVRGDTRQLAKSTKLAKYLMPRGYAFNNIRASYQAKITNFDIQGSYGGVRTPEKTTSSLTGYGPFILENGTLKNQVNVRIGVLDDSKDFSDRQMYFVNVKHGTISTLRSFDTPRLDYLTQYRDLTVDRAAEFYVLKHNQVSSDNFRLYYPAQNTLANAGVLAPCSSTRALIEGIVCPVSSVTVPVYSNTVVPPPPPAPLPPPPPPPSSTSKPVINSFISDPSQIVKGQQAQISWSVTNATSVSITNMGAVALTGSRIVTPTSDTSYVLTATNSNGSITSTISITVTLPTPTIVFTASPEEITVGQSVTLTWSTTNATSVTISGIGNVSTSGTKTVFPTESTEYTLIATNSVGVDIIKTISVDVRSVSPTPQPSPVPPPPSSGGGGGGSVSPSPTPPPTTSTSRHPRGALVNINGTIYFIGAEIKYPFPSAEVFLSWGVKFSDVVPATQGDIAMPTGPAVEYKTQTAVRHPRATLVNINGTVFFLGADLRYPFPSAEVFLSWGARFEDVVPGNTGDIAMPIGPVVQMKQ